jgi:hypothetical protein
MSTLEGFNFDEADKANEEGMKKAAAKKAEKEEAIKEAKEKNKKTQDEYFKDQRTPKSPLIAKAELEKMKAITGSQASMISPQGNTTAAGRGAAYGGGDLEKGMAGSRFKPTAKAKGGTIKSASSRADGCCIRGKTRA